MCSYEKYKYQVTRYNNKYNRIPKKVLSGGRVVYKIDQRFLIMPKVSRMLIKCKAVLQKVGKTQHFFLFGQRGRYEEDISCFRCIYYIPNSHMLTCRTHHKHNNIISFCGRHEATVTWEREKQVRECNQLVSVQMLHLKVTSLITKSSLIFHLKETKRLQ